MEELSIVRKRARVWPIVLALLVLALIAAAVFYAMGSSAPVEQIGFAPGHETWLTWRDCSAGPALLPLTGGIDGIA